MKPWAWARTPHGSKVHIVNEFDLHAGRRGVTLICRYGTYPLREDEPYLSDHLAELGLEPCARCIELLGRRVQWWTEIHRTVVAITSMRTV